MKEERDGGLITNTISGAFAGFCVVAAGHPFDLIKMRLQTSSSNIGLLETLNGIVRRGGLRGLYQGAAAPFMAITPIFALNFYGYSLGQNIYRRLLDLDNFASHPPSWKQYSFGALFSGLQTALIVIPGDRIKVFMQRSGNENISIRDAIKNIHSSFGIGGLFRGASLTMGRDLPGIMIFFTSYEILKKNLCPKMIDEKHFKLKNNFSIMASGGLAGMASWTISLPFDVIKSRLQSMDPLELKTLTNGSRLPSLVLLKNLILREGFPALYRGIIPVMIRAFVANGACFLGYEFCRDFLKKK